MVFNILVANTDDHEKNHALLCHTKGRTMKLELRPAYDVAPTGSGALAHQFMVSETSREPSLPKAMGGAESFDLSRWMLPILLPTSSSWSMVGKHTFGRWV